MAIVRWSIPDHQASSVTHIVPQRQTGTGDEMMFSRQQLNRAALLLGLTGADPVGAAVAMVPVCATDGPPDPTARLTARALSGAG